MDSCAGADGDVGAIVDEYVCVGAAGYSGRDVGQREQVATRKIALADLEQVNFGLDGARNQFNQRGQLIATLVRSHSGPIRDQVDEGMRTTAYQSLHPAIHSG